MATPFLDLEIFLFVFSSYVFLTFDKWIPNKYHSITLRTLRTMNKCNNIKIKNNVSEKLLWVIIDNRLVLTEHLNITCKKPNLKL